MPRDIPGLPANRVQVDTESVIWLAGVVKGGMATNLIYFKFKSCTV